MQTQTRHSSQTISLIGIFGALILLQSFVPMVGYIRIFPGLPQISTVHLTVLIGAILVGYRGAAILGGFWGVLSLIIAYTTAPDPLSFALFHQPLIAILPRVLAPVVAVWVYQRLHRWPNLGLILAGVLGAFTNTIGVIICTWLVYAGSASHLIAGATGWQLGAILAGMFLTNALFEAGLAGIGVPLIGRVLLHLQHRL